MSMTREDIFRNIGYYYIHYEVVGCMLHKRKVPELNDPRIDDTLCHFHARPIGEGRHI